jgi:hypothetical protein
VDEMLRSLVISALVGVSIIPSAGPAHANDQTVFAGCVTERAESTIMLVTGSHEIITIDTSWLKPAAADALSADCLTVRVLSVDGRYMAESVDAGDEPNEVNSLTNETTRDRK